MRGPPCFLSLAHGPHFPGGIMLLTILADCVWKVGFRNVTVFKRQLPRWRGVGCWWKHSETDLPAQKERGKGWAEKQCVDASGSGGQHGDRWMEATCHPSCSFSIRPEGSRTADRALAAADMAPLKDPTSPSTDPLCVWCCPDFATRRPPGFHSKAKWETFVSYREHTPFM